MTNINVLIEQAIEALKKHYSENHPEEPVKEFSTLDPAEQEEIKTAFEVIIRSTGLFEKVEALQKEIELCHAKSTCCCGDYVKDHNIGSGHSPVSMYDHALAGAEERGRLKERERCLEIINTEEEAPGDPSEEHVAKMIEAGPIATVRAAIRATKKSLINRIVEQ